MLVLVGGAARTGHACTTLFVPEYLGAPADGDTDVPTDVQLSVDALALGIHGHDPEVMNAALTTDDGSGPDVVIERPYVWSYVLTPQQNLEPNTTYQLTLTWPEAEPASMQFTTGEGALSEAPAAPVAALQHYRLADAPLSSCSPAASGTCIALPADTWVEARFVDEFGQQGKPYLYNGAFLSNLSGIDQGTNFECVELRARALNGAVSDEVTLCGDSAPLFVFDDESMVECTAAGFPAAESLEPQDAGESGCATAGPARGGSRAAAWGLLCVLGGAALRRCRATEGRHSARQRHRRTPN